MPVFNNALAGAAGSGGADAYTIERSLRFNRSDGAYLNNYFLEGNRKTWTWSGWVKQSNVSTGYQHLFTAGTGVIARISPTGGGDRNIRFCSFDGSIFTWNLTTTAEFRDPFAWYHIIFVLDTTQTTASERAKIYVNGKQITDFLGTPVYPTLDYEDTVNSIVDHRIGEYTGNSFPMDGYLADVHFIDGQALAATDFGEFDNNGVWQPIEFTGSYGTGRSLGSTSPTVFVSGTADGGSLSDLNTDANVLYKSDSNGGFCRIVPHTPVTGVTNIKFRGGSYTLNGYYVVIVNGKQIGGSRQTVASYGDDVSVDIPEQDIKSFEVRSIDDGYALGDVRFNDTFVAGTPSYGSTAAGVNSFHLDFSDNSSDAALGDDSSGNVANDWTVNNLTARGAAWDQSQTWSSLGTGTPYTSAYDWDKAFNGITTTNSDIAFANAGTTMTWTPSTAITVNDKVVIYAYNQTDESSYGIRVNGSYLPSTGGYGTAITKTAAELSNQLTSIDIITNDGALGGYLGGVEVDGQLLVDPGVADTTVKNIDSLLESPTNYDDGTNIGGNYATLNPLVGVNLSLSDGNLKETAGGSWSRVFPTIMPKTGKWYVECLLTNYTYGSRTFNVGVAPLENLPSSVTGKPGSETDEIAYEAQFQKISVSGSNSQTALSTYTSNSIVGVAMDFDARTVQFYLNGSAEGTAETFPSTTKDYTFIIGALAASGTTDAIVNFGQRPFAYTPPTGYKSLCTQNLDESTYASIPDGSDYFDVALDTGANILSSTKALCNNGADFLWIKDRDNSNTNHHLIDIVRDPQLDGTPYLISNDTDDEATLGTYSAPSGASVGWAWDAGTSTGDNTDGSITSSVRANPSAGFSIVSYTGSGNSDTVGHGLNAAPGMILLKNRDTSLNWAVYHSALTNPANDYLVLNLPDGGDTISGYWGTTGSNAFGLIAGTYANNRLNDEYIAYCWAPVEGYSAFGSYTGNGDPDGPFVYTGFRPRWVMVKSTDAAYGWLIVDSERNTYNYVDNYLYANATADENNNVSTLFTFTSNGFKLGQAAATNNNGTNYIYAAFAEHPFKTARAF